MGFISDLLIEISSFRIRVGNKLNTLANRIGVLNNLTTTNKNDLVEAINEVRSSVPTNYVTTNTNQTGLSGNKTTSGVWTFNSQINTVSHGNSSQWKQAFDWGNFRDYGLGTNAIISNNWDSITATGFYRNITTADIGIPIGVTSISVSHIEMTSTNATQMAIRTSSNQMWFRARNNGVWSDWVQFYHTGNFNPAQYLPLAGGTMAGDINFNNSGIGLSKSGDKRIQLRGVDTVISAQATGTTSGIIIRPQGGNIGNGAVTIQGNGTILTQNHGNSSQWKQAYDWGDFRQFGLGTGGNAISDFDNQPVGSMGYTHSSTLNQPSGLGYGALFKFGSTSSFTQIFGAYTQSNRLFFRHYRNGTYYPLVELYHTGNLTTATATVDGLIKLGSNTVNTATAAAVSATASRTYLTQLNSSGQLVVNVPWSNTTYSAGTLALLQAGTNATNRVWSASILAQRFTEIEQQVAYFNDVDNINTRVDWGTNVLAGERNQIQGARNIVKGEDINIFGSRNVSSGINNQINGFANVVNGAFNTLTGAYSSIAGSQANIIGNYLFARDKQTVLGMYNKVYDLGADEGLRFAFGTGMNDLDKFNAVEIYDDHRTEFHGKAAYDEETRNPAWFTEDYAHVDTYQMGYDHLTHAAGSSTPCEHNILEVAVRGNDRFVRVQAFELAFNIHGIVKGNLIEGNIDRTKVHTKGTLQFSDAVRTELLARADISKNPYLVVEYIFDKEKIYVKYVGAFYLKEAKRNDDRIVYIIGSFINKRGPSGQPDITYFEFNQQII